jgi:hypothetical protein
LYSLFRINKNLCPRLPSCRFVPPFRSRNRLAGSVALVTAAVLLHGCGGGGGYVNEQEVPATGVQVKTPALSPDEIALAIEFLDTLTDGYQP